MARSVPRRLLAGPADELCPEAAAKCTCTLAKALGGAREEGGTILTNNRAAYPRMVVGEGESWLEPGTGE